MDERSYLTMPEQVALLAILVAGKGATTNKLKETIHTRMESLVSTSGIRVTLKRLELNGFVEIELVSIGNGQRSNIHNVTPAGFDALKYTFMVMDRMGKGLKF